MAAQSADGNYESADLALAVYLEEVCDGRQVLFIGEDSDGAAARLGRVARQVRTDRRVPRLDPASFDVIVISDLDTAGVSDAAAVEDLARAVGPDGVIVLAASADGATGYEGLFALAGEAFTSVRMLGQSRFSAYSLVDFAAEPSEHEVPTLDGSLVPEDRAERFVALCAESAARLDAYAVIRVPEARRRRRRRGSAGEAASAAPQSSPVGGDDGQFDELTQKLTAAEAELRKARDRAEELEHDVAARTTELERLREELEGLAADRERMAGLEVEVDRLREELDDAHRAVTVVADVDLGAEERRAVEAEFASLGERLRERGRVLAEARRELDRRATLVRDLVEELREAQGNASVVAVVPEAASDAVRPSDESAKAGDAALLAERDRAVRRAVEAEAARAEAGFTVDELMGELAAQAERLEQLLVTEAELSGRVRGLTSRWAEADELHELAAARTMLAEDDLVAARQKIRALEGELGEVREQLELEIVRAQSQPKSAVAPLEPREEPAPAPVNTASTRVALDEAREELAALQASEARLSERVSELSGQLMAAQDLVAAAGVTSAEGADARGGVLEELADAMRTLASVTEERDHARAENIRLTIMVGSLEDRFAGARRGYELRIAELDHDLSMARETVQGPSPADVARRDALEGELNGVRARLADREAALAALRGAAKSASEAGPGVDAYRAAQDEADRLREQVAELKDRETDLTVRLADAEELSELEATRANDLASTVAARDALVNRLQLDLADEERRSREAQESSDRAREENERLRTAVVDASERISDVEAVESRADELAEALKSALTRAETFGGRADAAEEVLGYAREHLGALVARLQEGGVSFGQTSVGIDAPDGAWNEPGAGASEAQRGELARLTSRIATFEREATEKDTLIRSMTAQLEERDHRLRTLEARQVAVSDDELHRNLLELQERAAKLSEELAAERRAKRDAEAGSSERRSDELKTLHETLGDRDAELLVLRGQVSSSQRNIKTFREAAAETRAGLEELLGAATAHGDPGTAERIGGLLRVLSRIS